uniref:Uncharacterized protein n=1 Tax=Physcomitrium patens TaxID=3218 RepID=A0A2K1J886_PHYPA|nr:hypothetical protein PHYPA_020845 [Physcomitrium patens]
MTHPPLLKPAIQVACVAQNPWTTSNVVNVSRSFGHNTGNYPHYRPPDSVCRPTSDQDCGTMGPTPPSSAAVDHTVDARHHVAATTALVLPLYSRGSILGWEYTTTCVRGETFAGTVGGSCISPKLNLFLRRAMDVSFCK